MKCCLLFLIYFSFHITIQAQFPISPNARDENNLRLGHWTMLYDSAWREVNDKDSARYYRLIFFENGKPKGKVRDFYKSGQKQWDGYLTAVNPDVFEGQYSSFHENGKVKSVSTYVNGKANGPYQFYSADGILQEKGTYKNDTLSGRRSVYHENGKLLYEVEIEKGVLNGAMISYHDNGQVKARGKMVNSFKEGLWEFWYSNGNIQSRSYHAKNELNGPTEDYNESGKLIEKGQCKDSYREGNYTFYYPETGIPKEVCEYVAPNGKNGLWKEYYEDGTLKSEGLMVDNQKHGFFIHYHPNKVVKSKGNYIDSEQSGEWIDYHDNGQIALIGNYTSTDNMEGRVISYYPNGKIKKEGEFYNGEKQGEWKLYDEDGSVTLEHYKNNLLHGEYIKYLNNGSISDKANFQDDLLQGSRINYYPNGKINFETYYDSGQVSGIYNSFYEDGSPNVKAQYINNKLHGSYLSKYNSGNVDVRGRYDHGRKIIQWEDFYENGNASIIKKYRIDKYTWIEYHENGLKKSEGEGTISGDDDLRNGFQKKYFANGVLNNQGTNINGNPEGKFVFYDSITGKKYTEGNFVNGKYNGIWKFYNAKGKLESTGSYLNGFSETAGNIKDSINTLMSLEEYDLALKHIEWYKKILKRDVPKTDAKWAYYYKWLGEIFLNRSEVEKALENYTKFRDEVVRLEGDTTHNYILALNGMANTYSDMGKHEESYRINDLLLSKSDPDCIASPVYMFNRAIESHYLKRTEEGVKALTDEWQRREKIFGSKSSQALDALERLALFHNSYEANYVQALERYNLLLSYITPDDNLYLPTLRTISVVYYNMNKFPESITWLTKAIDYQKEKKLQEYHLYFSDIIKLSSRYVSNNKYVDALNTVKEPIQILITKNKVRSYEGAMLLNEAATILAWQFVDYKSALIYAEEAKNILDEIGRTEIDLYASVLEVLALCYYIDPITTLQAEKYYKLLTNFKQKKYGNNSSHYFTSLLSISNYYSNNFRFAKSDSVLQIVEKGVRANLSEDHYLYASCNDNYGLLMIMQYRYSESINYYNKVKDYYEPQKEKNPRKYARVLKDMAFVYGMWNNAALAEKLLREALQVYEKYISVDIPEYVDMQMALADVLQKRMLYTEASTLVQTTVKSYLDIMGENNVKYRLAIYQLGKIYAMKGEYKLAEEKFKSSAALSLKYSGSPTEKNYFLIMQELASLKTSQNQMAEAEMYYKKGRQAGKPYDNDAMYFLFLQEYGKFCMGQSSYILAEELLSESAAIARRLVGENHWFFAGVAINLSKVYRFMGKLAESEDLLQRAMINTEANKNEDADSYIISLRSLAQNFRSMGRYEEAEKLHQTILAFVKKKEGKNAWYGRELVDAATLYLDWEKYDSVKLLMEEALVIFEETLAPDNSNVLNAKNLLGLVALRNQDFAEAEKYFSHVLDKRLASGFVNTVACANAYHNSAAVLSFQGKFEKAEEYFKKSLTIRKENNIQNSLEGEANILDDIAIMYQLWGKAEIAETYWKLTLEKLSTHIRINFPFMSDYEKAKFWQRNKVDFENFNTFAVQRQQKNQALLGDMYNYRLATKGILLSASNKLRKRIYASRDSVLINQYHQWTEIREVVAKEYTRAVSETKSPRIDSLERIINTLEKELSLSADDSKEERDRLINWKNVQRSLGPDEVAIEFVRYHHYDKHLTDSIVYVALILTSETKTAPKIVIYPDGKFLENKAYRFYRNSVVNQLEDNLSHKNFWAPIESLVKNKRRLYVSLDGVFNQINFKTLRAPEGLYLMENKDFVIVSNTRDLVAMKVRKKIKLFESASLIGNPKFYLHQKYREGNSTTREVDDTDRTNIAALPGTGVEVQNIENLMVEYGWKVNALVETNASEANIKQLPSSRVIHFATHGFFQDTQTQNWSTADPMMRSGILLTGAANFIQNRTDSAGENGILTAYEAANLSLEGTEMVVLSACETARGEIQQGEGVYGLQRAFITAGAESLIMSLWKVDDIATQKLMLLFYTNWMKGMEKSEALNQAQRTLKKEYPHPYYWGAFVMIKG